jgi:hypothetical protein
MVLRDDCRRCFGAIQKARVKAFSTDEMGVKIFHSQ